MAGVTVHARATAPLNPFRGLSRIFEADVPPGATAIGEKAEACRVKSGALWANADDRAARTIMTPPSGRGARTAFIFRLQFFHLHFKDWDLTMSRVSTQLPSIPPIRQKAASDSKSLTGRNRDGIQHTITSF